MGCSVASLQFLILQGVYRGWWEISFDAIRVLADELHFYVIGCVTYKEIAIN